MIDEDYIKKSIVDLSILMEHCKKGNILYSICHTIHNANRVFVCGNGGSSSSGEILLAE